MNYQKLKTTDLFWELDFSPRVPWPTTLPVVAARVNDLIVVLAGFERKSAGQELDVLTLTEHPQKILQEIYPEGKLASLEGLRLRANVEKLFCQLKIAPQSQLISTQRDAFLLDWPLELQNFFDQKQMALKSLRPLQFLNDWKSDLTEELLESPFSSSQIREALDLLCDLKMSGKSWSECVPDQTPWLQKLKKLRTPKTSQSDDQAQALVKSVSWPRGLTAKWERQGDQAGILLHTRIHSSLEWRRLRENLQKLEIGDGFWQTSSEQEETLQ